MLELEPDNCIAQEFVPVIEERLKIGMIDIQYRYYINYKNQSINVLPFLILILLQYKHLVG